MTQTSSSAASGGGPADPPALDAGRDNVAELPSARRTTRSAPAPRKGRTRGVLFGILGLALAGAAWGGGVWWTEGRFLVSTDDAFVKADTTTIAAREAGHVLSVKVADNAFVHAGDVLAEIDPGDYAFAVASAEGRIATQTATIARIAAEADAQRSLIAQAEAQLAAARADVDRTAADLDRAEALAKANYGTPQRVDQARADRDRTRAAVAVAAAGVAAARATLDVFEAQRREAEATKRELETALDRARRDLDFATVRAPVDGVVGNRAVQVGQYVQPGTRLLALVPLDAVYVEANFKETQLARLHPGQKVTVEVDALGGREVEGRVDGVAPASGAEFSLLPPENATGNFTKIVQRVPVKITLDAAAAREHVLRPGLSVYATVDTRTH